MRFIGRFMVEFGILSSLPTAPVLGFVALPGTVLAVICGFTVLYV